jgi:hypothetical protein
VGPQGIHRKLAAILAADVAGYTRLMEEDVFGHLQVFGELGHVLGRQVAVLDDLDPENISALVLLGRVSRMPRPPPEGGVEAALGRFVNPDPRAGLERAELNLEMAVTFCGIMSALPRIADEL